jgi:hypothetical protein
MQLFMTQCVDDLSDLFVNIDPQLLALTADHPPVHALDYDRVVIHHIVHLRVQVECLKQSHGLILGDIFNNFVQIAPEVISVLKALRGRGTTVHLFSLKVNPVIGVLVKYAYLNQVEVEPEIDVHSRQ